MAVRLLYLIIRGLGVAPEPIALDLVSEGATLRDPGGHSTWSSGEA
jgi:hypothetical protein